MFRILALALCILAAMSAQLPAKPVSSVYGLHMRYGKAEMIELVPGIEVPVDMWDDDHVVTAADLVAVGIAIEDAEKIVSQKPRGTAMFPCTWSRLKYCASNGIPLDECCGKTKDTG
jgi:hypothetical protein